MKLWIDDIRPMPESFNQWVKTASEAISFVEQGIVKEISFDHDLGDGFGTGYEVAKRIEELAFEKKIKPIVWHIHSANPVGRKNIEAAMKSAERYWKNERN